MHDQHCVERQPRSTDQPCWLHRAFSDRIRSTVRVLFDVNAPVSTQTPAGSCRITGDSESQTFPRISDSQSVLVAYTGNQ